MIRSRAEGRETRDVALSRCVQSLALDSRHSTLDFIICRQTNHAFGAGQNFLWVDPFGRGAFEPGHFAVVFFREPVLKLPALARGAVNGNRQSPVRRLVPNGICLSNFGRDCAAPTPLFLRPPIPSVPSPSSPAGLREFELMHDLLRDFAGGPDVGVDQHVGLPVKRLARGQQVADFLLRVGSCSRGRCVWLRTRSQIFSGEAQRQTTRAWVLRLARFTGLAGRPPPVAMTVRSGRPVRRPLAVRACGKPASPSVVKNVRDGPAGARLNQFVRVEIIEMQLLGHEPAHGSFARAHETDEREIDERRVLFTAMD